jgi:hypothetical protein
VRLITFEGVDHRLSEKNWQQLLRRFDAGKSKPYAYGYNFIRVNSICVNRGYKCIRCPLRDPHKRINSCTYMFKKIIGKDLFPYLNMLDCGIIWDQKHDTQVREALQKVTDVLSSAEKVPGKKRKLEKSRHS